MENNNEDYWIKFWNENQILKSDNPQLQVGRSINKVPIEDKKWKYTLDFIESKLNLTSSDHLLDLCAGNGLISMPLSKKCEQVTAVDISNELIKKINTQKHPKIKTIVSDARKLDFPKQSFSKVILYFALQHFTEQETIRLMEKVYKWLRPDGLFFIGDIPDSKKLWTFFNTPARQKTYFDSLKFNRPIIGTWFSKKFLCNAAICSGFSECNIIIQSKELINHHYRFDLLLKK